jgi:hypothetical protein
MLARKGDIQFAKERASNSPYCTSPKRQNHDTNVRVQLELFNCYSSLFELIIAINSNISKALMF